jgi:hypothetical protein
MAAKIKKNRKSNKCTAKGKGHPISRHEVSVGEYGYRCILALTPALHRVGDQIHTRESDLVSIVLEAGWIPAPVWMDSRTVQPLASRYTD